MNAPEIPDIPTTPGQVRSNEVPFPYDEFLKETTPVATALYALWTFYYTLAISVAYVLLASVNKIMTQEAWAMLPLSIFMILVAVSLTMYLFFERSLNATKANHAHLKKVHVRFAMDSQSFWYASDQPEFHQFTLTRTPGAYITDTLLVVYDNAYTAFYLPVSSLNSPDDIELIKDHLRKAGKLNRRTMTGKLNPVNESLD